MKKIIYFLGCFLLTANGVMAQTLLSQDFTGATMPPSGWSIDAHTSNWSISQTKNAGGTIPEARFVYSPTFNGISRLITPVINYPQGSNLIFSFIQLVDHYTSNYYIGVASRIPGGSWFTEWQVQVTANISAQQKFVGLSNPDLTGQQVELCFFFNGNSNNIDYWYIDNVKLLVLHQRNASYADLLLPFYAEAGSPVKGSIANVGLDYVTSADLSYQVDGGMVHNCNISGLTLGYSQSCTFVFPDSLNVSPGPHQIKTWIDQVNGMGPDMDQSDDTLVRSFYCVSKLVHRKPLFEGFSSSTCPPCGVFYNTIFNPFLANHGDSLCLIRYPLNFPGAGDPYYTADAGTRKSYYGVNLVPYLLVNGSSVTTSAGPINTAYQNTVDDVTYMELQANHILLPGDSFAAQVNLVPHAFGNLTLYAAVVEKETYMNTGTSGETVFYNVLMDMFQHANGLAVNFQDSLPQHFLFIRDMTGTHVEEMSDLVLVTWLQNPLTKEVVQSAYSEPGPVGNDIIVSKLVAPVSGFNLSENENITVRIVNSGLVPASQIPLTVMMNGLVLGSEMVNDTLTPGDSLDYTFPFPADLSLYNEYNIVVYSDYVTDFFNNNDTACSKIINLDPDKKIYAFGRGTDILQSTGPVCFEKNHPGLLFFLAGQEDLDPISGGTWADGDWYVVTGDEGESDLIKIDTSDGAATVIGSTGHPFLAITYDWYTGTLFGLSGESPQNLYAIDRMSASSEYIGTTGLTTLSSLGCDNWGHLYTMDTSSGQLGTLDKFTCAFEPVATLPESTSGLTDMEFDYSDSTMLVTIDHEGVGKLYQVRLDSFNFVFMGDFLANALVSGLSVPIEGPTFYQQDAGIWKFIYPADPEYLNDTTAVTVVVQNLGILALSDFPLSFQIDDGQVVTEFFTDTLERGEWKAFSFQPVYDFTTTFGLWKMKAYTGLAGDEDPMNDTVRRTVINTSEPQVLYDNGPIVTHPGQGFAGKDLSMVQQSLGLTSTGFNAGGMNRLADGFTVPNDETWNISHVGLYAFQTGSGVWPSLESVSLKIWSGNPDTGTLVFQTPDDGHIKWSYFSDIYRVTEDDPGSNARPVMKVIIAIPAVNLNSGSYYLDWHLTGTLTDGPEVPPVTLLEITTTGDAIQFNGSEWVTVLDNGTQTAQDLPFRLYGTVVGGSSLQGVVSYFNPGQTPLNDVHLYLQQNSQVFDSTATTNGGEYLFQNVAPGQDYSFDVSCGIPHGGTNAVDALLAMKHFVGLSPLTGLKLRAADVDGSGNPNAVDALLIMKRFVGMTTSFSVGDWTFDDPVFSILPLATVTQDIHGLCFGDIDASYLIPVKSSPEIIPGNGTCLLFTPGNVTEVPVIARNKICFHSLSWDMQIPPGTEITGLNSQPMDNGVMLYLQKGDHLRVAFYTLNPCMLEPGEILMTLKAKFSSAPLGDFILKEGSMLTDFEGNILSDAQFLIPELIQATGDFSVGSGYPNPTEDKMNFPMVFPGKCQVSFELLDMNGTQVLRNEDVGIMEGIGVLTINLKGLSSGVYSLRVLAHGERKEYFKTLRVIKVN